jgi:glyoxylase I family protein
MPDTSSLPPPAKVLQLHHCAYRARDAEETRHFYEDILGLPLYHLIQNDHVPSTGEYCPYTHFFFRLKDGSFIAFFDLGDDTAALPSPNTPAWVNHIAFNVDSIQALEDSKTRLQAHGVEVLGITDHRIFKSIYFLRRLPLGYAALFIIFFIFLVLHSLSDDLSGLRASY